MPHFQSDYQPGQNGFRDKVLDDSKMDNVGSKTRSLGQILEKHCVRSRGHISCPIIMKPGKNVFLDRISDEFENEACQVKNYVARPNVIKKKKCTL